MLESEQAGNAAMETFPAAFRLSHQKSTIIRIIKDVREGADDDDDDDALDSRIRMIRRGSLRILQGSGGFYLIQLDASSKQVRL